MKKNQKIIYAVSLGPGSAQLLTPEAKNIIEKCDTIVGYKSYLQQFEHLLQNKKIIVNGMRGEIDRCEQALDATLAGESVAVVSSGDVGIYAMAGLLLELIEYHGEKYADIEVVSTPGVTAATAAAAALGAPLMNDFAMLSLSNLLTPTEIIKKRIKGIAISGLVCALYNPASTKRRELLELCINEFIAERGGDIYVGIVWHASKKQEEKLICKIKDFPFDKINMNTMIIIGNEFTVLNHNKLYTDRGYCKKYYNNK